MCLRVTIREGRGSPKLLFGEGGVHPVTIREGGFPELRFGEGGVPELVFGRSRTICETRGMSRSPTIAGSGQLVAVSRCSWRKCRPCESWM